MFTPVIVLKAVETDGLPNMKKSEVNKCLKDAWEAVGRWWLTKRLPEHFTMKAAGTYGYKKRSKRHQKRKQARFHHQLPLVFTGQLRRQVLSPGRQRVVATRKGVKVRLAHEAKYNYRPEIRGELISVTAAEVTLMEKVFVAALEKAIEERGKRKTRRVLS